MKIGKPKYPYSVARYPRFRQLRKLFFSEQEHPVNIFVDAFNRLDPWDHSDDANLVRVGVYLTEIYFRMGRSTPATELLPHFPNVNPTAGVARLEMDTRRAYFGDLPKALYYLRKNWESRAKTTLKEAIRVVRASGVFQDLPPLAISSRFTKKTKRREARLPPAIALESTLNIERRFGLEKPAPAEREIADGSFSEVDLALRLIANILVFGWQRFRSITNLELQHFITGPVSLDIIIPDSKGGRIMQRLPMMNLAPQEEVRFIRLAINRFIELGHDPNTRLTRLAGLGKINGNGRRARNLYRHALSRFGGSKYATHATRRLGLSLAPVRLLCARHPELLNSGLLHPDWTDSRLFRSDVLAAFARLFPAEGTDQVEIVRRIAGWKSYTQFFDAYCQTWPDLVGFHLNLIQKEQSLMSNN